MNQYASASQGSHRLTAWGRGGGEVHLFKGSRPAGALHLTRDMLPGDSLAIQFTSFDELVDGTLRGGVEVTHDHAQGITVALAHDVVHDIQQRPQLGNLHAEKEHQDVQLYFGYNIQQRLCDWDVHVEKEHQDVQHCAMDDSQQRLQLGSASREGTSGCAALCHGRLSAASATGICK